MLCYAGTCCVCDHAYVEQVHVVIVVIFMWYRYMWLSSYLCGTGTCGCDPIYVVQVHAVTDHANVVQVHVVNVIMIMWYRYVL